ncbi:MAG: 30S ribosomal protein S20 [Candidatus Shapirobacteria bacterium]
MPIGKSAKKSLRKAESNYVRNQTRKKNLKATVKGAFKKPTPESTKAAISTIDKALKNHLLHKNKVARLKSRLAKLSKPVVKDKKVIAKAVKPKTSKSKTTAKKMK